MRRPDCEAWGARGEGVWKCRNIKKPRSTNKTIPKVTASTTTTAPGRRGTTALGFRFVSKRRSWLGSILDLNRGSLGFPS